MYIFYYFWQKIALTKETKTCLETFGYIWKETPALETNVSCNLEVTSDYMEVHTSRG